MRLETEQHLSDRLLDDMLEEIGARLQSGEAPQLEELASQYPDMAERIERLYPALIAMAAFDPSATNGGKPSLSSLGEHEGTGAENRTLGDFRIIRQIGRGGMGVVYEAEQLSVSRSVALKVLPLASLIDERALVRFRNEVRAAATLEHPGIVSVYSVGEDRGVHFYAMQLIRGQSLASVIRALRDVGRSEGTLNGSSISQVVSETADENRNPDSPSTDQDAAAMPETRAQGDSQTPLTHFDQTFFRNVARLGIRAADALQHAHEHGVAHRDVKPGNLLLDRDGQLFVADFGLARIETDAGVTLTGDVLGTLRYMSPEQVLGHRVVIDHRTDIYSLGATLYEMVTLQPVHRGDDRPELIRRISFEEPEAPRKLNPSVPGDLETVVLKALSKNPRERYESARHLVDDLQRFLDNKPIVARRPTVIERCNKWARRNPTVVWAVVLVMAACTVASTVSAVMIWNADQETRRALLQSGRNFDEAQKQAARAEDSLDTVLGAVDDFIWRVGETHLLDVPGAYETRLDLIGEARDVLQSLLDPDNPSPRVQLRSAGALASHALAQIHLGNDEAAEDELEDAISEYREWLGKYPEHELKLRATQSLAGSHMELAALYSDRDDLTLALAEFQKAFDVDRMINLQPGANEQPRTLQLRGMLNRYFSDTLRALNRLPEAEAASRRAISAITALIELEPENPSHRIELARGYRRLGAAYQNRRDRARAVPQYEQAVSILREWGEKATDVIYAKEALADVLRDWAVLVANDAKSPQMEEARSLITEAAEIYRKLAQQFPKLPRCRESLTDIYLQLAYFCWELGDQTESINVLELAIGVQQSLVDDFPDNPSHLSRLGHLFGNLSNVSDDDLRSREALGEATRHFETLVSLFPNHPEYRFDLVKAYYNQGNTYDWAGQYSESEAWFQKAIQLNGPLVDDFPDNSDFRSQLLTLENSLGNVHLAAEDFHRAKERFERALEHAEKLVKGDPTRPQHVEQLTKTRFNIATVKSALGEHEGAADVFRESIELYRDLVARHPFDATNRYNYANGHINLGMTYKEADQPRQAAEHLEKGSEILTKLLRESPSGTVKEKIASTYADLIRVYGQFGQVGKAKTTILGAADATAAFMVEEPGNGALAKSFRQIAAASRGLVNDETYREILQRCADVTIDSLGDEHPQLLVTLNQLGLAHQNLSEWAAAIHCFQKVIDARRRLHAENDSDVVNTRYLGGALCNLGNVQRGQGQLTESLGTFEQAIEILEELSKTDSAPQTRSFLRNCYVGNGESERQLERYQEAILNHRKTLELASTPLQRSESQLRLAMCFHALRQYDQAIDANLQATRHEETAAIANYNLGCQYALTNQADKAFDALQRAIDYGYGTLDELQSDPDLAELKGDPRFAQMMARLLSRESTEAIDNRSLP